MGKRNTIIGVSSLMLSGAFAAGAGIALAEDQNEQSLPSPDAQSVWDHVTEHQYQENWALWPGTSEMYEGTEPHGAVLTTYVNPIAEEALSDLSGEMPRGSVIVKENYKPPQQLMAVTVMYKAAQGYNPDHNNWFWLKRLADGTVEASGKVESCQACHGVSQNDYLRTPLPER